MVDSKASKSLNALKLFFCILIIYLHMHHQMPTMDSMPDAGSFFYNGLRVVREIVSNLLTKVAVPGFAFISGYLFFATTEFNLSVYKNKLHKRFFSLVIPYITWVLVVFVGDVVLACLGKSNLVSTTEWNFINVLNIFWGIKSNLAGFCPYNGPMWYIRDLILIAIISPAIWLCLKKKVLRFIFLLLLFVLWLHPVFFPPHETIMLFFFSLGGFFPILKVDLFSLFERLSKNWLWIILWGMVSLLAIVSAFIEIGLPRGYIVKAFIILLFPFPFYFARFCTSERILKLSKCTFVVYCMHNIVLATFGKITNGMVSSINLVFYFLLPIVTFLLGYCVYLFLIKFNNRTLNLLFLGKR